MKLVGLAAAWSPALLTPGAALFLLQQWSPFIIALAGVAGTALALAIRNYSKIREQDTRLSQVETLTPKRSTDRPAASPSAPGAVASSAEVRSSGGPAAGSPVQGQCGTDG